MRQISVQNFNERCSQATTPSICITSGLLGLVFRAWIPLTMRQISNQKTDNWYTHLVITIQTRHQAG